MSEEKKMSLDAEELAGVAGGDETDAPDPENKGPKCPKCGSINTVCVGPEWMCLDCGYMWP